MSKELPYFKFFPGEWITGDITLESMELQGVFINVCCTYWSKECRVAMAALKQRYGEAIAKLCKTGILKEKQDFAVIEFLNEQWTELYERHENNVKNGIKGAEKKWGKNSHPLALREEKIIKEKKIEDNINLPTELEFLNYCKEVLKEKYQPLEFSLKAKYEAWVDNKWKDGNDAKIKNWKTKIKNTIPYLKPEYKSSANTDAVYKPLPKKDHDAELKRLLSIAKK